MSAHGVRFRASFRTARRLARNGATCATASCHAEEKSDGPSRAARLLALAHFLERQIEAGVFRSYGDAARRIGVTAGRMTQVMNLLLLAPGIQERLLSGDLQCGERRLRQVASQPDWNGQRTLFAGGI